MLLDFGRRTAKMLRMSLFMRGTRRWSSSDLSLSILNLEALGLNHIGVVQGPLKGDLVVGLVPTLLRDHPDYGFEF